MKRYLRTELCFLFLCGMFFGLEPFSLKRILSVPRFATFHHVQHRNTSASAHPFRVCVNGFRVCWVDDKAGRVHDSRSPTLYRLVVRHPVSYTPSYKPTPNTHRITQSEWVRFCTHTLSTGCPSIDCGLATLHSPRSQTRDSTRGK